MPLNYSKWDQLELSDDSDIEGHPNVDHKSLVRMRQRQIHEQREMRKYTIKNLIAQIACNEVLLPRIEKIYADLCSPSSSTPIPVYFNSLVDRLQTNPSPDCPPGNDGTKIEQTYDGMLLSLLKMVGEKAKEKVNEAGVLEADKEERLSKELANEMLVHVKHLGETIEKDKKDLANEEAEQKKHITMDDLHDGFESHYIPPTPEPPAVPIKATEKGKQKEKVTEIEVLNPIAVAAPSSKVADPEDDDDEEAGLPELTPSLEAFSKIALWNYEKSFEFIQQHRDVYVPGASDALLVAAFTSQGEGNSKYAKQCVHQSLLIQYCEKLGRDGVGIFFKKMVSGDKRALKVFVDDVESTYKHLVERVRINKEEAKANEGREQIQLVPENPDQVISFNVPDGPPPENLVLEGPGTEGLDIEQVRRALQFRWDVYQNFPEELQEALKKGGLDDVNQVLGDMDVASAEGVVNSLDATGILNFADGGIRDQTGEHRA